MKRIIITGANGFIGRWLVKSFASDGYEVIAVVRNKSSDVSAIENISGVKICYCELNNIEMLPEIISEKCDLFLHFAWKATVGADLSNFDVQTENYSAACAAVKAAKKIGCQRFVTANSIKSYEAKGYVLNDKAVPSPAYCYSITKLMVSMMTKTLAASLGIEHIDAVISNCYGTGKSAPFFMNRLARSIINNEHLKLTTCEQLYDFVFVSDVAEAVKIAAIKGEPFCMYYIGNEEQYPLKQFVLEAAEILNPDVKIDFGAVPFNGIYYNYHSLFDTYKLSKLGFQPKVSFREGIKMLADEIRGSKK